MPFIDPRKNPKAQRADLTSGDGTYDEPYGGLNAQTQFTPHQVRHLSFVRWSLRHNRDHFSEFPSDPTDPTDKDE